MLRDVIFQGSGTLFGQLLRHHFLGQCVRQRAESQVKRVQGFKPWSLLAHHLLLSDDRLIRYQQLEK